MAKQRRKQPKDSEKLPKSIIVIGVLILLFIIGWISGIVPYTLKYVECGKAPTTIDHFVLWSGSSSGVVQEPNDEGYGPGITKSYICQSKDKLYPDNTPME